MTERGSQLRHLYKEMYSSLLGDQYSAKKSILPETDPLMSCDAFAIM